MDKSGAACEEEKLLPAPWILKPHERHWSLAASLMTLNFNKALSVSYCEMGMDLCETESNTTCAIVGYIPNITV